jgi:hypothetical protein
MKNITFRLMLFKLRHFLGALAAAAVAWVPFTKGLQAYEPISSHGECGFLCIFLLIAVFWWVIAIAGAVFIWFALVKLLHPVHSEHGDG